MFPSKTNLPARRTRLVLAVGLAAVMATVPVVAASAQPSPAPPPAPLYTVSRIALGVNVPPWDGVYAAPVSKGGGEDVIQSLLPASGIDLMRYGGGLYADYYDWQTNTDIQTCIYGNPEGSFTGAPFPYDTTAPFQGVSCDSKDYLPFGQFSSNAKAVGAQSFVTVNYGSGSPALAAAWVADAKATPGDSVALWEVGNETYLCSEVNNWLAQYPEYFQGYDPDLGYTPSVANTCPQATQQEGTAAGLQTLANTYAVNARPFLLAMKDADPSAQIGVPWDNSGADTSEFNDTVLRQDGSLVSFVDVHYYPSGFFGSTGGSNPSDQQVLQYLMSVPSQYRGIQQTLATYDPRAKVVVGETSPSYNDTTTGFTPLGALFAAGDVLSWLAAGAESVDDWEMNDYVNLGSSLTSPDSSMFTSSSPYAYCSPSSCPTSSVPGEPPIAESPYYGYVLASKLAKPGARLGVLATSDPTDVIAWQSELGPASEAVALLNTNTSSSKTVTFRPNQRLAGQLETWSYSAGTQNSTNSEIVQGTMSASSLTKGLTLPPESLVILEE